MESLKVSEILCRNCVRYKIIYKSRFFSLFEELNSSFSTNSQSSLSFGNQQDLIQAPLKKNEANKESNGVKEDFDEEDEKNIAINSKIKESNEYELELDTHIKCSGYEHRMGLISKKEAK